MMIQILINYKIMVRSDNTRLVITEYRLVILLTLLINCSSFEPRRDHKCAGGF